MLKSNKKAEKFRRIVTILIAISIIIGIFIKVKYKQKIELKTIGTEQIEHMNATTSAGNGTINPIYRPKWTKVSSTLNTDAQILSIVVKGNASESKTDNGVNINYNSDVTSALAAKDIMVYIDGELDGDINKNGIIDEGETPSITKTVSDASPSQTSAEVTHTITLSNFGEALRQNGKEFTEWSGNIAIKIGGRGQAENTYNTNVLTDKYGNENMMESDEDTTDGSWVSVVFKDGSIDHNATGTMFADFIKPEFTYEYSNTTIDHDTKKVTLVFDITDKYFKESTLTADKITVKLGGIEATNATKELTKLSDITATVNGTASTKIGEKYQLVVSKLDQKDGGDYSGIMTLAFPERIATDKSGNQSLAKTITVGIDDPTTGDGDNSGVIVDVVDPIWKTENIVIDGATKTVTVDLIATDKYLTGVQNSTLTTDDIILTVDGSTNANTAITKELSEPEFSTNVTTGLKEIKYTLTLTNWEEASLQEGKDFLEYSGTLKIKIPAGTVTDDQSGATNGRVDGKHNTNKETTFTIGHVDFIKPRIETVSTTRDTEAKTETIIFNVIDKYLDTSDEITDDEITVLVDKETVTGMTKTLTRVTANDKSITVNGKTQVVLQQYKLVLSNFEQSRTTIDTTKNFVDWSGTVSLEIPEGAVKDQGSKAEGSTADNSTSANKLEKTTINADFVDFIQPKVTYQYVTGDINYNTKTFTMKFDITDKYFSNSTLATEYANATTDEAKLEVLQKYLTIKVDGEDITKDNDVIKKLIAIEDVRATKAINKTVNGTVQTGLTNQLIGKSFTLEISQLQQDTVDTGDQYLDYSGVITVAVKANSATDKGPTGDGTNASGNIATTITSGVSIPGGSGTGTIVDVVDPIWEVAGTATAQPAKKTASIPVKGTDKYLKTISLTANDITVEVDGVVKTSVDGVVVTVTEDTSASLTYGKQYIIKVDGYSSYAYQVKVTLKEGLIVDNSGNKSKKTSFVLFSSLKETSTETNGTSGFLGNTKIQRRKIEKIIFQDNLDGINDTKWDVTQIQDQSIWGWYTTNSTTGNYTVYIGSYIIMNGNVNSSYLFTYIGYDSTCQVTGDTDATDETQKPLIENLDLLHVDGVTNMTAMFLGFGYSKMKSLDLGSSFDTSNVTDMKKMFLNCGATAMTSLNLGDNFDTSNVTNMQRMFTMTGEWAMTSLDLGDKFATSKVTNMNRMFNSTGSAAMTSLDLGDKFDTSNVTDMEMMFSSTGYSAMTSLNLKSKFNTSKVTNMKEMFHYCGHTAMTSLNLGDNFDTSKVTNMNRMFDSTGYTAMTALDLGDKFYTTSVTDMGYMFNSCGQTVMVALDLGPCFTKIVSTNTDMFSKTGKSGAIIYAPESIFSDEKNFKLDSTSTTTISYARGTINPIYKPEFTKISSTLDTTSTTPSMTVVVKGNANKSKTINGININYQSDVINTLTANDITVYINGEKAESITKEILSATTSTNETTGKTEVTYTIKLSDFDQGTRQKDVNGNLIKFNEWSGNVALQFAKGKLKDKYGSQINSNGELETNIAGNGNLAEYVNSSNETQKIIVEEDKQYELNTDGKLFADVVKPNFTYESSETTINQGTKTVTVIFDVADKYFSTSELATDTSASNITVSVGGKVATNATKTLSKLSDLTATVNGKANTKVGERYKLVVTGLDQGDGSDYSGIMTMAFAADLVKDKSDNGNLAKTITIGIDDPTTGDDHNNGQIVDVVSPAWSIASADPDTGIIKIRVKDKYLTKDLSKFELEKEDIKIVVNGIESTAIVKTLEGPTEIEADKEYEYTLTLSNLAPSGGGYTEFPPIDPIVGGTAKYRNENGGNIQLRMLAGTVTDQYGNKTVQQDLLVGNIDITEPEIYYIQKTRDMENNKETIVFNVTDKNYNKDKVITVDEMTLWIDGTQVDSQVTKEITSAVEIKTMIDGQERTVGHQYTLEIGSIVETDQEFIDSNRAYRELSGTLEIRINKDAASDLRGNTINEDTTTIRDTTDLIRPEVKYQFATSDINKDDKTFTMIFEMKDKYYSESTSTELSVEDLTIKIDGKVPNWNEVTRILNVENISEIVNGASKVIGKRYTLKLSNLEQLQVKDGDNYRDYSGVITVGIPADKIADETGNKNIAKTITSGVNIPGGTGAGQVVDVVAPLIEKISTSANAINKTATIKFKVTDKYFKASTITEDNIKVFVNGTETTEGITKTLSSTDLKEARVSGETTTNVQYGVEYTLTVTGFATDAGQVKIQIPAGLVTDNYSNSNIATEIIAYNVLKKTYTGTYSDTNSESRTTAGFLGNTSIQRQNIDNITFVNGIGAANTTKWDVSARGDNSILAWYTTNANGSVKVYIGSDAEIFANQDSRDLFAYIGYSDKCTSTETITNIDLLNVTCVTNMYGMFIGTGYNAMTKLDLGNKFNTSNVTDMTNMFALVGYNSMTVLNLGNNFDTSKVTNMKQMFGDTGHMEMTSLNLGDKFDTSSVTNMNGMFLLCGGAKMTNLNLGDKFDTSNVTNMYQMFSSTGYDAMTSLNLGNKFNTSKVTDMGNMFSSTGKYAMTSLKLGDKFDTSNVTNMRLMFAKCGQYVMTSLNLGDKFNVSKVTNMSSMFEKCGQYAMTSLNLGDKFDTSSVTDMSLMFAECGSDKMTSLDLGNKFNTNKVTTMYQMFKDCGNTAMTVLDLGPAFTKIANTNTNIFTNTGKSGAVIYVPESIYKNRTSFKKSSTDTSTAAGAIAVSSGRTVNPIYRPEWTKTSSALKPNATAPTSLEVTVKGSASKTQTTNGVSINYNSNVTSTLSAEDITVYINGVQDGDRNGNGVIDAGETPVIGITVSEGTPSSTNTAEITQKITLTNFEEAARQDGKSYKEWSGNISIKIGGREEATSTYTSNVLKDAYGNQSMSATDETGSWVNVLYKDADLDGNNAKNTDGTMFTDFIKPEFTYIYSNGNINQTDKTLTVEFSITDKYFGSSTLLDKANDIVVKVIDTDPNVVIPNEKITKELTKTEDITGTVNGKTQKIGEKYKLVIKGLQQPIEDGKFRDYSGPMSISIPAGAASDRSGNSNIATTITIGVNEPGGDSGNQEIVDVVSPVWSIASVNPDTGVIKIRVKDKYLTKASSRFELTKEDIKIVVNGIDSTAIVKTLDGPTEITANKEYEYTLTLSNLAPEGGEYTEFTPIDPIVGGTAKYRNENGGNIQLRMLAGSVTDQYGNATEQQDLSIGNVDVTSPEIYYIQKNRDIENNKETIIFNVTDKNYDKDNPITVDEMTIWVDGTQVDSQVTKEITNAVAIKTTIDGKERVVGHQYTLEIGSIVETDQEFIDSNRKYRELSGTLEIKINKEAATDLRGNTLNEATTTITDTTDLIRPEVKYQFATSNINKDDKTFTMVFEMIDKYYKESASTALSINDLIIKIDGEVPNWNEVTRNLKVENTSATVNGASKVIGKKYTLTLSNLEQLQVKDGDNYLDYSGVITVAIPANKMADETGNKNIAKTITSGVNIPGGTGTGQVVDVVAPLIEKISTSANAINKTATIKFKVTDKYFKASTITEDNIKYL